MQKKILRRPAVSEASGIPRATLYLRISQGLWTKPVNLSNGGRSVGWPASEVEALNTARIAGKSDDEIRDLVVMLEASRKALA